MLSYNSFVSEQKIIQNTFNIVYHSSNFNLSMTFMKYNVAFQRDFVEYNGTKLPTENALLRSAYA